jgi:hypothetical protein
LVAGANSDVRQRERAGLLGLLRQSGGATIAAITKATGWQQYSVRGCFVGVVRKTLGLDLDSDKQEGGEGRCRIVAAKSSLPKSKAAGATGTASNQVFASNRPPITH